MEAVYGHCRRNTIQEAVCLDSHARWRERGHSQALYTITGSSEAENIIANAPLPQSSLIEMPMVCFYFVKISLF